MRCVKIDSPYGLRSPSPAPGPEPSPSRTVSGDERRRSGYGINTKLSTGGGIDCDRETEAVREKFLTDLRDEMDKIRANYIVEEAEPGKEENTVRPWNLRTRRADRRAPVGGSDGENGNGYLISLLKPSLRSGAEKKREERTKFCPTLTRKEVEDDFMKMTGQRPLRKHKKRPRAVQKQLDVSGICHFLNLISSNWVCLHSPRSVFPASLI